MAERAAETRAGPGTLPSRRARQRAHFNDPRWDDLWHILPVGNDGDDVAAWEHNWTGQQVVVRRDPDAGHVIEARYGDVIDVVDEYDALETAIAFASGLMQGHIDGEVIGDD